MVSDRRPDDHRVLPYGRAAIRTAACIGGGIAAACLIAAVAAGSLWPLAGLALAAGVPAFVVRFFRNPRRQTPAGEDLAIAPADGRIVSIEACREEAFIGGPAIRIAIFMSVFDVHVNRAPCRGRIERTVHRPGRYRNAMLACASEENESNAIGLVRPDGGRVLVRQIAGAIARRIVCIVGPGTEVAPGEFIGMIKFGSRVEVYVPADGGFEVRVRLGDRARGGETVLGEWRRCESP
ncbi:MAG: phosphatidylserine decarboxylase family protein [Planctomycetes bacterium]|nr:phosphatidylserine decarboxylase family protein [Planctomycetota bacterium]